MILLTNYVLCTYIFIFFFYSYGDHRDLHSFPTRRSSDLRLVGDVAFAEAVTVAGAITPVPGGVGPMTIACRSEEHTSELQSRQYLVCRLLLEKKKKQQEDRPIHLGHLLLQESLRAHVLQQ